MLSTKYVFNHKFTGDKQIFFCVTHTFKNRVYIILFLD